MPIIEADMPAATIERFWSKVDKNGPVPERRPDLGPCWLWTAAKGPRGDGAFYLPGGGTARAHRVAYVLAYGPIPSGLEVDHLCFVPSCVNPGHLEAVTGPENTRRALPFRAPRERRTHCPAGHEYTPDNSRLDPRGTSHCRTCDRDNSRRRSERRAQARIERLGHDPGPYARNYIERDDKGRISVKRA